MAAANPLRQLRDIHVPDPPGFWPPAPGWWLVALLVVVAAVWLVRRQRRAARRRRPIEHARRLYDAIYRRYRAGEISGRAYLDQTNEVLKRALIHGVGEQEARRATGEAWLRLLDRHLGGDTFTRGPGRVLGDARFRPRLAADVSALHPHLERLLEGLTPRRQGEAP